MGFVCGESEHEISPCHPEALLAALDLNLKVRQLPVTDDISSGRALPVRIAIRLDEVVGLLPSLNAPTIANLYQKSWFSVETVVSEDEVRDLIPKLKKHGAEGIIEYSLNKVI